jgi:hypothetical protein
VSFALILKSRVACAPRPFYLQQPLDTSHAVKPSPPTRFWPSIGSDKALYMSYSLSMCLGCVTCIIFDFRQRVRSFPSD